MKIEKIKAIKDRFCESTGPSESVALGLKTDAGDFILGEFYIGPHMSPEADERKKKVEGLIDHIVKLAGEGE